MIQRYEPAASYIESSPLANAGLSCMPDAGAGRPLALPNRQVHFHTEAHDSFNPMLGGYAPPPRRLFG